MKRGVCRVGLDGCENQISDAARLEGARRLQILEFEEDTAEVVVSRDRGFVSKSGLGWEGRGTDQPAALERAADSRRGVSTQGFGRTRSLVLPIAASWGLIDVCCCSSEYIMPLVWGVR